MAAGQIADCPFSLLWSASPSYHLSYNMMPMCMSMVLAKAIGAACMARVNPYHLQRLSDSPVKLWSEMTCSSACWGLILAMQAACLLWPASAKALRHMLFSIACISMLGDECASLTRTWALASIQRLRCGMCSVNNLTMSDRRNGRPSGRFLPRVRKKRKKKTAP